jgi:2-polyprenyl-3-methyl-5-hydroxy-6-metoxy-1,4-benzoquinol methylase
MPRSGGGSGAPLLHPDEQRPQFAPRQPLTPTAHDRGIGIQGARDTFDLDWRSTMTLIQIGCGQSPIAGWVNYDNSPSVRLAKLPPALIQLAGRLKLLDRQSIAYVSFCRANSIGHCNATRHIPWPDGSVEVIYSSHMIEHLDRQDADLFLREARRVLRPGGVIRLSTPGLKQLVSTYADQGDGDRFIASLFTCVDRPRSLLARLRDAFNGPRHHLWLYDETSLCALLERHGFHDATALKPGRTTLQQPGALNLWERMAESIYVEATR